MNDQALTLTTIICLGLYTGASMVLRGIEWVEYQARKV